MNSAIPIVYVEDSVDDAFFMQMAFERASVPHPLVVLNDGQRGIDYLAGDGEFGDRSKHPVPCLILLDLNLPVKSGFEVLEWIRSHPELKATKVVVVSASGQHSDMVRAKGLGVTDYVVKPSAVSRLIQLVNERVGSWLACVP